MTSPTYKARIIFFITCASLMGDAFLSWVDSSTVGVGRSLGSPLSALVFPALALIIIETLISFSALFVLAQAGVEFYKGETLAALKSFAYLTLPIGLLIVGTLLSLYPCSPQGCLEDHLVLFALPGNLILWILHVNMPH